jgi:hypothetical protein
LTITHFINACPWFLISKLRIKGFGFVAGWASRSSWPWIHSPYHHYGLCHTASVKLDDFAEVTMKHNVLWDVRPGASWENQCFGGRYRLHHQGGKNFFAASFLLPVTANNVHSSTILVTLKRNFL